MCAAVVKHPAHKGTKLRDASSTRRNPHSVSAEEQDLFCKLSNRRRQIAVCGYCLNALLLSGEQTQSSCIQIVYQLKSNHSFKNYSCDTLYMRRDGGIKPYLEINILLSAMNG